MMSDKMGRVPRYDDLISNSLTNSSKNNNQAVNNNARSQVQTNNRQTNNKPNHNSSDTKSPKQPRKKKGTKKLNVRHSNLKKQKNSKLVLKTVAIVGTLVVGLAGTAFLINHNRDKIEVPEQFVSTGVAIEAEYRLDEIENDFALLKLNNWKNGISDNSLNNINFCESNKVPYGIIIESDASNEKEAKADAAIADAILDGKNLSCPIYYDITGICENLSPEQVSQITESFTEGLQTSYEVGVCVAEDYLIEHDGFECEKLVICDDSQIGYTGEYDMCYFSQTEDYYSSRDFSKKTIYIDERGEYDIKGIDVSQFQGEIDWGTVAQQNVNFVIMRYCDFKNVHKGSSLDIDDRFYEYAAACEALDMPYGIYCFSRATTVAEAKLEAKIVLDALESHGLKPDLPIYYDTETSFHFDNPSKTVELVKTFCSELEAKGYRAGLYASYSLVKDMCQADPSLKDMDKWVARYKYNNYRGYDEVLEDQIPDVSDIGKYNAVQITDQAVLDGITENTVDVNFANESIRRLR